MAEYYRSKRIKSGKILAWVILGSLIAGLGLFVFSGRDTGKSVFGEMKISYEFEKLVKPKANLDIEALVGKDEGEYGVYVLDLNKKEGYGYQEKAKMPTMSIAKVPVMVAVYQEIEAGKLDLDKKFSVVIEQISDTPEASGSAKPEVIKKTVQMSVATMLKEMGYRSDNVSAGVLINAVGKAKIRQVVSDLGMTDTDFDQNETTAKDVVTMWQTLRNDENIISQENKQMLFKDLQNSVYEDRIAKGLPEGTKLVHKVGQDIDVWNDSGIVETDEPFVIAILNRDINMEEAKVTVPKIAQAIWERQNGTE